MKPLLCLLMLSLSAMGGDEYKSITLKDGTVLVDAEVKGISPAALKIVHSTGVGEYPYAKLPESFRVKYNPTREEAEQAAAEKKKKEAGEKPEPKAPAKPVIPGSNRADCVTAWGAFQGEYTKDTTDWDVAGVLVTATWKDSKLSRLDIVAKNKTWAEIAAALKMDSLKASDVKDLTPLRQSWTLSDGSGVKWNVKGTLSKEGAKTFDVLNLTP